MEFYLIESDIGFDEIVKARDRENAIEEYNKDLDCLGGEIMAKQLVVTQMTRLQAVNYKAEQLGIEFEEIEEEDF